MTRLLLLLLWLLHWLPFPVLGVLGKWVGWLLYLLARERRHIVQVNLGLLFPAIVGAEESRWRNGTLSPSGATWWRPVCGGGRLLRVSGGW